MERFVEEQLKDILDKRVFPRLSKNGDGCWRWTGHVDKYGYGRINIRRRAIDYCKNFYIHRLVYAWAFGSIPKNREIHHKCKTRSCCNPDHLEKTTRKANMADRWDFKKPEGIDVDRF